MSGTLRKKSLPLKALRRRCCFWRDALTGLRTEIMKKKDLCAKAGISPASVTKMGRNGHVTTEILLKICTALNCGIEDIIEIVPDDK